MLNLETPVIVERRASATGKTLDEQDAVIRDGRGTYSHDDELPIKVRVKRSSTWFRRTISVTTLEDVFYKDAYTTIRVKSGFTFDLASIPKPLWFFVSPWDIALESLFHDVAYREQKVRQRSADQMLLSMMEDRGVPWHIRWAVYLGVRIGGWMAWNANADKSRAEKAAELAAEQTAAAVAREAEAQQLKAEAQKAVEAAAEAMQEATQSSLAADVSTEYAQWEKRDEIV